VAVEAVVAASWSSWVAGWAALRPPTMAVVALAGFCCSMSVGALPDGEKKCMVSYLKSYMLVIGI